jgi:hypothetical protein
MPLYPNHIARCQHIKVNGTQCNSPSLRETTFCYYHIRYHWPAMQQMEDCREFSDNLFPTLEDANSIQATLAKVMQRLFTSEIDHKTAALLLYALQTASINLKRTTLEPKLPTQVVIDRKSIAKRPIGATAWSPVEGQEYDEVENEDAPNDKPNQPEVKKSAPDLAKKEKEDKEDKKEKAVDPEEAQRGRQCAEHFNYLVEGLERDPKFLDKPAEPGKFGYHPQEKPPDPPDLTLENVSPSG